MTLEVFLKFIEALIYNVVLISAVQQNDAFFMFSSIMVYYRIFNIVPCSIIVGPCCLSIYV